MTKIIINAVSAKSGGAATYIYNLACELAKAKPSYQYIFYVPPSQVKTMQSLGDHVTVVATDVGCKSSWLRFLWDQVILRQIVKREKIDVLLSSSDFGMFFPACRQILMIRNTLFFSQSYIKKILPYKSWRFKLEFLFRPWLISLSAKSSDVILTASQSILNDVQRFIAIPHGKAVVNYFGVPLEKFRAKRWKSDQSQDGSLRMLYVSEYSDYKNLTTLLKAILVLKKQANNDFSLTTTMHPDQFPDVEIVTRHEDLDLASRPDIASCVNFTGAIPYEQIPKLYQEADVFVFPSLAESFGHPLVEAMASGLPVIASDIPICHEICGDAAVYFSPLDPQDLADKITMLKNNLELRVQLGQIGRKRAETQFDWKDHIRWLVETIEKVAANERA